MSYSLSTAAARPKVMAPSASKLFGIDMYGVFPAGGLASATVSCIAASQSGANGATGAVATSDLTIGSPSINATILTSDEGRTVAAGQAVQVQISGGVDGGNYTLKIGATDGTNTDYVYCQLQIRATPPS